MGIFRVDGVCVLGEGGSAPIGLNSEDRPGEHALNAFAP